MDVKSGHSSPVMTDSPPISNSRLTIRQNRVPYSSATTALSQNNNLLLTVPRKKTGILDDVIKSNGWIDAMKSSSPPPSILNKDSDASTDMTYPEWTVRPLWFSLFTIFFSLNIVLILTHSCFCVFSSSSIHQLLLLLRKSRVLQKAKE